MKHDLKKPKFPVPFSKIHIANDYCTNHGKKRPNLTREREIEVFKKLSKLRVNSWLRVFNYPKLIKLALDNIKKLIVKENAKEIKSFILGFSGDMSDEEKLNICDAINDLDRNRNLLKIVLKHEDFDDIFNEIKVLTDLVVTSNLRLVVLLAKKTNLKEDSFKDACQNGVFGLIKAIARFDYKKGFRFITYADRWITMFITRGYQNNRLIRIPTSNIDRQKLISRACDKFRLINGREPDFEELSKMTGLKKHILKNAEDRIIGNFEWLDSYKEPEFLLDIPFHKPKLDTFCEKNINNILKMVTSRERTVLRYRFGFVDGCEWTLRAIGEILDISSEQVRKDQQRAVEKIKRRLNV